MPTQQAFNVSFREECPLKKQRHSHPFEEEPSADSEEMEEPEDIDLEGTSESSVPRAAVVHEVASSEAEEDASEEDEDEDEEGNEDDED